MNRTFALLALLTIVSGCAAPTMQDRSAPVSLEGSVQPAPSEWNVGDWWDTRFFMDLGPGYREEGAGRVVVASRDATGYELLAADRGLAVVDYYFDLFHVGRFDPTRQPIVEGEPVHMFPKILEPGSTWSAWFPVPVFGPDRVQPSPGNLTAAKYDDEHDDGRLRITGIIDAGFFLDLDFDSSLNWFSYVRLTETATGRIALSIDVDRHGDGYTGTLHNVTGTILHERLTVTPPCSGPGACDPALANVPPAMTINAGSHGFAELVTYLFSFPVTQAGGGVVEFVTTDPSGSPSRFSHAGVGDTFQGTFFRAPYEEDPQGAWTFHYHIAGTAGAYTALFGLDDHPVEV